jgi:DNA-binding response OmpR family regulator
MPIANIARRRLSVAQCQNIIVVDQDPWVADLATNVLNGLGHRALIAENAERALAIATAFGGEIGLLVTAVILPTTNGLDLAVQLRRSAPGLRVIYLSAPKDPINVRGTVHEGSSALMKPFTREQFAYVVGVLLGQTVLNDGR